MRRIFFFLISRFLAEILGRSKKRRVRNLIWTISKKRLVRNLIWTFLKKMFKSGYEPAFFSIAPKFQRENGKLKKKCATCPQIHTKREFIILGIKVLSPIFFLICGHVAHKIELNWWHIKKTFKLACKTKQKFKKKTFFSKF